MSEETSEKKEISDPPNTEALDPEVPEPNDLSRGKKVLLSLSVFILISGLTWGILRYAVFIPEQNARIKQEQQRVLLAKQQAKLAKEVKEAEEARLEKIERERLERLERLEKERIEHLAKLAAIKLKEEKRLKRIQKNSIACKVAIKEKRWKIAEKHLGSLLDEQHDLVEISKLQERIDQGKDTERKILLKVNSLLAQTRRLDTGIYSVEAIRLLDEALTLHPNHPVASALRKKMNAYQSEFRIPEDYPNIAEVIPKLRAGDTILLSKGTYNLSSILTKPVTIKGAGIGKTIIETDTTKQSAFVFLHDGKAKEKTSKLSDLTIRGTTYQDFNIDRYPLVLVKSKVTMKNTLIEMSSGHGVAVLSGSLNIQNSEITANGWDGISIRGEGAVAHISNCKIHTNYDHGVDFWKDASGSILESEIYENSGSGIVVMGKKATVKITQVRSYKNEQCGIVATGEASIDLVRVVTANNVLSGIVVQGENSKANFGMVISNNNKEAGYYLDPASKVTGYEHTTSEGNAKGNLIRKALEYSIERQDQ